MAIMKTNRNPKIEHDFLANLPTEIMLDIFWRLHTGSIMSCMCVCKSWRDLIETREFAESHYSRSVPCLALFQGQRSKLLEFVDTQNSGRHSINVVMGFSYPHNVPVYSSANGLLFLFNKYEQRPLNLFICNPVTREYIKIPPPMAISSSKNIILENSFGFGVSKKTGKYKVVRIFHSYVQRNVKWRVKDSCKCEVYTLGTGSWTNVAVGGPLNYNKRMAGVFLNGNLHWLAKDELKGKRISYFDLETECFSSFSIPKGCHSARNISLLRDCLCLYDVRDAIVVIWLMNKYGDDRSWRKEVVIERQHPHDVFLLATVPIKMLKDGDIMFGHPSILQLYLYSSKTKTSREIDLRGSSSKFGFVPMIYIPSFVPLKTIAVEKVSSF